MSADELPMPAPGRRRAAGRPAGQPRLLHEAVFAPGPRGMLEFAVPFLREGLDAGERAAVAVGPGLAEDIRSALGDPRLEVLAAGSAPSVSDALTGVRDAAASHDDRRLRLVGQAPYGGDPRRWTEWMRFEALVNRELVTSPLWLVCFQDEDEEAPEVLANARRTHPVARPAPGEPVLPNPAYVEPDAVLADLAAGRPDPLQARPPDLEPPPVVGLADLPRLRVRLEQALGPRLTNFVAAVNEVVTNAVEHGAPPAEVRVWTAPDRVVCTVRDRGSGFPDPGVGYSARHLAHDGSGAFGLRVVRRLVDGMDHHLDEDGFVVRLTSGR